MKRVSAVKSIGLVISMLLNGCTTNSITDNNVSGNDLTATEVIRLMGNGINLGNTLEAYNHKSYVELGVDPTSFETLWGQPVTTRDMIDDMKAMGFDTLRIPVAWTNGINYESGDYTIDERLMNRVDEVVNYALDADMYVIPTSGKHAMTDTKCRRTLQRTSFCFQYIITRRGTIAVTAMQNGGELPAIMRSRIPFFRC